MFVFKDELKRKTSLLNFQTVDQPIFLYSKFFQNLELQLQVSI